MVFIFHSLHSTRHEHPIVKHGIEVCAHLGLNPQIHVKKALQARNAESEMGLLRQSVALQEAGVFILVCELVSHVYCKKLHPAYFTNQF
jgi:ketopantoate hydroxymethyltransferase